MTSRTRTTTTAAIMAAALILPTPAAAQLNGGNIKGDAGLKSGSQPPPGTYIAVPLWFYSADAVKDRNGNEIRRGSLDAAVFGAGVIVLEVYDVTARLGAGGMGEVYRATDSRLKRDVALKVLPADVAGDAARLTRFQREAELLASLNHQNIAHVHGLEESASTVPRHARRPVVRIFMAPRAE